jgi:DNA gyrase/topoisomerase IV subunit A
MFIPVKWLEVHRVPEAGRYSMGKAIVNLVALDEGEKISACIPVKEFDPNKFLMFATKKGLVKKTSGVARRLTSAANRAIHSSGVVSGVTVTASRRCCIIARVL